MAERYIPEHRRSNFKAKGTFKQDELRRRREEQQVEIRKQKRDENLAKRRNLNLNSPPPGSGVDSDDESARLESQVVFLYHFFFCVVDDHNPLFCITWRGKMRRGTNILAPLR